MRLGRVLKHIAVPHFRTRRLFPKATLDAIEAAIGRAERTHGGEICFVIETALAPLQVANDVSARARALDVFTRLKVWDTEHNNGVLIYVQIADRAVEIVADRGLAKRVSPAEWEAVCRLMEEHFRNGRYQAGSIAGVDAAGALLARHYPADATREPGHNELPDRPTLL
jgi:uncharacterized membrane protein